VQLPASRTDVTNGAEDDIARKEIMKSEVVTMRYVKAHTTIPVYWLRLRILMNYNNIPSENVTIPLVVHGLRRPDRFVQQ